MWRCVNIVLEFLPWILVRFKTVDETIEETIEETIDEIIDELSESKKLQQSVRIIQRLR